MEPATGGHGWTAHTSPMALAEIMVKFLEQDLESLDHDVGPYMRQNKYSMVTSFTATKESIQWVRNYIADTLRHSRRNAQVESQNRKVGRLVQGRGIGRLAGTYDRLIGRLDELLLLVDSQIELVNIRNRSVFLSVRMYHRAA